MVLEIFQHHYSMKTNSISLKRIRAGRYETHDGRFEVAGFQRLEADDYGPKGEWRWYWRELPDGSAGDHFSTKREAVADLTVWASENH